MSSRKIWLAVLVFVLSFMFHFMGINQAGRTWDEQFKVDLGYIAWTRWAAGDFSVKSWSLGTEHPMIGKYLYGAMLPANMFELSTRGNPSDIRKDFNLEEKMKLYTYEYVPSQINDNLFAVDYDWTWARLMSDFFNSLALAGVFLITCWFIPDNWALIAPAVLLFTPRFLAMGKQVTFESITAGFIVWTVIAMERLLKNQKRTLLYVLVGLGCGLLIFTRYNNVYVLVLLFGWWFIYQLFSGKEKLLSRLFNWRLILIPTTAILFGYLTWPLIWHDFPKLLLSSVMENRTRAIGPTFYYLKSLLFTTPVVWLVGLISGLGVLILKKDKKSVFPVWWIASALLVFSIFGVQGGGTRYIFFIYPAIGVVTAVGFHFLLNEYSWGKYLLIPMFLYGVVISMLIHPYYLDYYNEIIGGVAGAAKSGMEVSYWGEGQREVGRYLNETGKKGASVSLLVTPFFVMPSLRHDFKVSKYGTFDEEYYVIISRTDLPKHLELLNSKYRLDYVAKAGGVGLVSLWEKK